MAVTDAMRAKYGANPRWRWRTKQSAIVASSLALTYVAGLLADTVASGVVFAAFVVVLIVSMVVWFRAIIGLVEAEESLDKTIQRIEDWSA